jgi:hypothetical protein
MLDQGSTQGNQIIRVDPEQPVKIFRVSRNCFFLQGVINLLDIARHCLRFAHGCWLRPHRGQGEGGSRGRRSGALPSGFSQPIVASCQGALPAMQHASIQAQHSHAL